MGGLLEGFREFTGGERSLVGICLLGGGSGGGLAEFGGGAIEGFGTFLEILRGLFVLAGGLLLLAGFPLGFGNLGLFRPLLRLVAGFGHIAAALGERGGFDLRCELGGGGGLGFLKALQGLGEIAFRERFHGSGDLLLALGQFCEGLGLGGFRSLGGRGGSFRSGG